MNYHTCPTLHIWRIYNIGNAFYFRECVLCGGILMTRIDGSKYVMGGQPYFEGETQWHAE